MASAAGGGWRAAAAETHRTPLDARQYNKTLNTHAEQMLKTRKNPAKECSGGGREAGVIEDGGQKICG